LAELGGGAPPPLPPVPAQLIMPSELKKIVTTQNNLRLLRLNASGRVSRPRATNNIRDEDILGVRSPVCAEVEAMPVAICTVALPVAFAARTSLVGLKLQAELDGRELQAKVKVPLDPLIVARVIVKLAVWPLETVRLD
jgi:hypothetical protein